MDCLSVGATMRRRSVVEGWLVLVEKRSVREVGVTSGMFNHGIMSRAKVLRRPSLGW